MLTRVHDVEARRDDADRPTPPLCANRPSVRMTIDAASQPGDHVDACRSQPVPDCSSSLAAGGRGVASADDGHPSTREQAEIAASEQHRRWQRIVEQAGRVPGMAVGQHLHPQVDAALPHLRGWALERTASPHRAYVVVGEHAR